MIYKVKLPKFTRERLTDIVYLQMRLIRYAASTSTLSQESCERYFKSYKRFQGRHQQIAEWIWRGSTKRELIEHFFNGSCSEKLEWSRCLFREVLILFNHPIGSITPHRNATMPSWKNAGADFLRKFYEEYLDGLPKSFFSEPGINKLSKVDIREEFNNTNEQLLVCPACDISPKRTQIDHYLPISLYPHLSCHPFNLVPVCGDCNSPLVKGNTDFLEKNSVTRRSLEDILLPYRSDGLATHTHLSFAFSKGYKNPNKIEFKNNSEMNLIEYIEVYCSAYQIPDRWLAGETFKIMESTLFRQIENSLRAAKRYKATLNIFDVRDCLDELLLSLHDDQGKTPFALPMTWWLTALLNKEVEPATLSPTVTETKNFQFLEEVAMWVYQETIQHPANISDPRLDKARRLRRIAAEGS
jgi:hypothetical protein